jgi:hypothetical protein
MAFKQIMVNEKVHRKIKKIAESNERSIAGQIKFWAEQDCSHPTDKRENLVVVAEAAEGQASRLVSICGQCGKVVA